MIRVRHATGRTNRRSWKKSNDEDEEFTNPNLPFFVPRVEASKFFHHFLDVIAMDTLTHNFLAELRVFVTSVLFTIGEVFFE